MKSIGIVRKVDELGRVVLPVELRRIFDIEEKDSLEIFTENDCIVLKKFNPSCVFCGNTENIMQFGDKNICTECVENIKKLTIE